MTPRERVIRTIEFGRPDRIPLWPRFEGTAWLRHGRALYDLLLRYPIDIGMPSAPPSPQPTRMTWTDDWGCTWRRQRPGLFGAVFEHPLAERERLDRYEFPDYSDPKYDSHFERIVEGHAHRDPSRYVLISGATEYGVLWYRMWWLRGMANALADTASDDGFVQELRDRIIETQLSYLRRVLAADVDGILFGDDWGTQEALMIAPERWRQIFKPAYRRLFDAVHDAGKHVVLETDGCTTAILGDWAEIGVDLLSVQLNAVGLGPAGQYRGRMCFFADPDRQRILPEGTPEEVDAHIRDIVDALDTPDGGLVGCLYVTEEVPLANVEAALDAFVRYGRRARSDAE